MNRDCIIYKITNVVTSQIYIGSSVDIKERIRRHFKDLKANKHHSLKMQRSYNKYGRDSFFVENLITIPEQYRQKTEQWFLDNNDCYFNNEKIVSKPSCLRVRSKEENERSRLRMLGNEYWKLCPPKTEDHKNKLRESARNRVWSDESRAKLSKSKKGNNGRNGYKHTAETKSKMVKSSPNKVEIHQYDLNNMFIREWESISEIVRTLGYEQASISRCCQGKQKTSYGFIFKYKNSQENIK